MKKRTLRALFLGALVLLASCVDKTYDLANKEIEKDVSIKGNLVKLPVGSLHAIRLDSIIDADSIDLLEMDPLTKLYSISVNDTIAPIEEVVDPIEINVEEIGDTVSIEFAEAEIHNVKLKEMELDPATFNVPNISFEELNDSLPVLSSNVDQSVTSTTLEEFFNLLESNPNLPYTEQTVKLHDTFSIENEAVNCDFEYELPGEVATISSIKLASRTDLSNTAKGALVEAVVTHPKALLDVKKTLDFDIKFPSCFVLSKCTDIPQADKYTVSPDAHSIIVNDLVADSNSTVVMFYINEMVNVDKMITNGVLSLKDSIVYTLNYNVDGDVTLNTNMKRTDFDFNIFLNLELGFNDVSGKTKEIGVDFSPIVMNFEGKFDDLKYVDRVNSVKFVEDSSMLKFHVGIETAWLQEISLQDGYALKIAFPENLSINAEKSIYNSGIVYKEEERAFYVSNLLSIANTEMCLALDSITLNKEVVDGVMPFDVKAEVSAVGLDGNPTSQLYLAPLETESLASTLNVLSGKKEAHFTMKESSLVVEDASVNTEKIVSKIDTHKEFTLDEEIPSDIELIESVDFEKPVTMQLNVDVKGLEELKTDLNLDFYVKLPSCLNIRKKDNSLSIIDDTLFVKKQHTPNGESLIIELECYGLNFAAEGGLEPVAVGETKHIKYSSEVSVVGDAFIDGMEFHSQVLDKTDKIELDAKFIIDPINVKTFHGIYNASLDEVEESVELELGDELSFLKDDGCSIVLAEPQIDILLTNTVGVPVDVNLEIVGRNKNGENISTADISTKLKILPAHYNEEDGTITPKQTKLFITSDTARVKKAGYTNVEVKNLANLLEKIPETIDLKITPVINTSSTHHIDITKPVGISGEYSVNIPLKFDDFNLCYNDTIADLNSTMGDVFDMFVNVSLGLKMNILNTLPLGLKLNAKALQADGTPLNDIVIEQVEIAAGSGSSIESADSTELQAVELKIKGNERDFGVLDQIVFTIEAATDHTVGSVGLKGEQGIKISDIVLEVAGDIETEL